MHLIMQRKIDREFPAFLFLWQDLCVFLEDLVSLEVTFWVIEQLVGDLISGEIVFFILLEQIEELEVIWFQFGHLLSLCLLFSRDREQQLFLCTQDLCLSVLKKHLKSSISFLELVGDLIRYGISKLVWKFSWQVEELGKALTKEC
jgi:hypothetical protein